MTFKSKGMSIFLKLGDSGYDIAQRVHLEVMKLGCLSMVEGWVSFINGIAGNSLR